MIITFWRKVVVWLGYCAAGLVILAALLVSTTRLLTPVLNDHIGDFEALAARFINRPVQIAKVEIVWNIYQPELFFHNVVLLDPKTQKPALKIPFIKIDIAILNSLFSRQFILDTLKVAGVHLTLHQQKSGEVSIEGFALTDNLTGQTLDPNVVLAWIFSQPKLILQNFNIHYIALNGTEKSIILKWLALSNGDRHHQLSGRAMLDQAMPTQVTINFRWEGDVTHLADVSANLYLYLENVSLPEWLGQRNWHNLTFKEGVGNAKIWAQWEHDQWQKIRSELQFYDLQITSSITQKDYVISRLNGNVGWERQGNVQYISGDHILLDLPKHLWPTNAFSFTLSDQLVVQNFAVDYLDLEDAHTFLTTTDLLTKGQEQDLSLLNPQGEVRNLQLSHLGSALTDINISAQFSHLNLNAWKYFPAVNHLQGKLQWDGKQGQFKLDSQSATVVFDKIFANPLVFDQLHGLATLQQDATNAWLLTAKNIQISNQDLHANADLSLTFPVNASPEINLTGNFAMTHADHINDYLPLKTYEPELVIWLHNAFSGGAIENGQAIVQGRLSDFPFADGNGKFIIRAMVKNIDLNYAPDWPILHNLNANLVFEGNGMTVDVTSGQILDIPLQAIHAEIPDLRADPMLIATSVVKTDIGQGQQFIEQSPLQRTIGKQLSALELQGPMELNLRLLVPLNNPDNTQVIGDTTITNVTVSLPVWNLMLSELSGAFQFTENAITANKLTGKLLGYPVTLGLATEAAKKTSSVTANLQGTIDTQQLSTWLALPVEKVLQGSATYQAKLSLPSKAAVTKMIVNSNLQGMQVKLPEYYGKSAKDPVNFALILEAQEKQPLKVKINYNELFSLALVLEKEQHAFSLVSADVNLGKEEAEWQTQPGLVITGIIDHLDWNQIQPYVKQFTEKNPASLLKKNDQFINPDMFRALDIRTHLLDILGLKLKNLHIQLTKTAENFVLGLDNDIMNGQIILSRENIFHTDIDAKFQRLVIPEDLPIGKNKIDPRGLPAISFVGDNVRFGDMQIGRVMIDLTPTAGGLFIRQFALQSPDYKLQGKGVWMNTASRLQGTIMTENVSRLLKAWGFSSDNLVGSTGSANFNLNWSGGLLSSLRAISGTISLKLGEGRIINLGETADAKLGLGKLLNILSLQSLPRRLSFHFNDLFEKGYSFDYVKGDFTLKNGNAITDNTRINGPLAGIAIMGRIGFASKDLDLKLGVTPYVTGSLPVVAAIATANPIAGVATWVVDKVVSHAMSQMTTYNYTIQGPWSNPVWNQLGTQKH